MNRIALVVVDVQRGCDDARWGRRNNLRCEKNIAALLDAWRAHGQPVVFVRHDSAEPDSPLRAGGPGNEFKDVLTGDPDVLVVKSVNSSFHGEPDLAAWLRGSGIDRLAICGIQTNMCCETTARVGSNLGFRIDFVIDATHTFDLPAQGDGTITADELTRVTATNLDPEFGRVWRTRELIADLGLSIRAA
jgi:nicotinamidase-related amidase